MGGSRNLSYHRILFFFSFSFFFHKFNKSGKTMNTPLLLCILIALVCAEVRSKSLAKDEVGEMPKKNQSRIARDYERERRAGDINIQVDKAATNAEQDDEAIMQAVNVTKNIQAGKALKDQDKIKNLIKPRRLATRYYTRYHTSFGKVYCPSSKTKKECVDHAEWLSRECCAKADCTTEEQREWYHEGYKPEDIKNFIEGYDCQKTKNMARAFEEAEEESR